MLTLVASFLLLTKKPAFTFDKDADAAWDGNRTLLAGPQIYVDSNLPFRHGSFVTLL